MHAGDLIIGLAKCVAYGAAIPDRIGYCGLSTFGGSEGVGWATTRAVVNSSLAVIILNFFISSAGPLGVAHDLVSQCLQVVRPKTVLNDVSFDIGDGEVFFIIGASGVGKSVLIKHLVGLLRPTRARSCSTAKRSAEFDEKAMYPVRKKCAMVFQHSTLFDSMTCARERRPPAPQAPGARAREALAEARERLGQVNMQEFGDRYPSELGDGMRKRVAIARALTLEPALRPVRRADDQPRSGERPPGRQAHPRASDTLGVTSSSSPTISRRSSRSPTAS